MPNYARILFIVYIFYHVVFAFKC